MSRLHKAGAILLGKLAMHELALIEKLTDQAIGLRILFEARAEEGNGVSDVRLGYLLSEASWGKGIASELVHGFVSWCREQESISSITGGVANDNPASKRVLEKNGFQLVQSGDNVTQGEQLYRMSFR